MTILLSFLQVLVILYTEDILLLLQFVSNILVMPWPKKCLETLFSFLVDFCFHAFRYVMCFSVQLNALLILVSDCDK